VDDFHILGATGLVDDDGAVVAHVWVSILEISMP
jgi:hypothetical protein